MSAPGDAETTALVALGRQLQAAGYRFTTVSPATHARVLVRAEASRAGSLADVFGWSRPFGPASVSPQLLAAMRAAGIVAAVDGDTYAMRSRVRASSLDGALFFHSAYPTLAHDAVFFGPDTYRFVRALSAMLERHAPVVGRALDLGCGAGAAAVAIARRYGAAHVVASDINARALELTSVNAALAGCINIRTINSDLFDKLDGSFDLITANPPYLLDGEQRAYRHGGGALGEGLSLDIVCSAIPRLSPGGHLLLYTGVAIIDGHDPFLAAAAPQLDAAGLSWHYSEIDPDVFGEELDRPAYAHADRIAAVVLHAHRL